MGATSSEVLKADKNEVEKADKNDSTFPRVAAEAEVQAKYFQGGWHPFTITVNEFILDMPSGGVEKGTNGKFGATGEANIIGFSGYGRDDAGNFTVSAMLTKDGAFTMKKSYTLWKWNYVGRLAESHMVRGLWEETDRSARFELELPFNPVVVKSTDNVPTKTAQ